MRKAALVATVSWSLAVALAAAITAWPPLYRAMPILAVLLAASGTLTMALLTARLLPAPLTAYILGRVDSVKAADAQRERLRVVR